MKKSIILTIAGIGALVAVAMMDDDTKNVVEIQHKAPAYFGGRYQILEASESLRGGVVCYLVNNRPRCLELVNNEVVEARR